MLGGAGSGANEATPHLTIFRDNALLLARRRRLSQALGLEAVVCEGLAAPLNYAVVSSLRVITKTIIHLCRLSDAFAASEDDSQAASTQYFCISES